MSVSRLAALDLAVPVLRCPACSELLSRDDARLRCGIGHSFDIARQGYASLLTGVRPTSGDDAAMVGARRRVLGAGAYAPVLAQLIRSASSEGSPPEIVVEAGCGPGYYLAGAMEAWPAARGLGLDSSVYALRAAAKVHPRVAAVACDLFGALPIASDSVDLVLCVFAPRNPAEFRRILRPEGRLVVVRPTGGHLAQLRGQVPGMVGIDPAKERRLEETMDPYFEAEGTVPTVYVASLTPGEAIDLLSMTPSARHMDVEEIDRDGGGSLPAEVDISVLTTAFRPR